MSSQNMHESRPASGDAIDGQGTQQQPKPPTHDIGGDDRTHPEEHGTSEEGGYREQDYGGEPTYPATEAPES